MARLGVSQLGQEKSGSLSHTPPPEAVTAAASSGCWTLRREGQARSSPRQGPPQGTWRCHWHDRTPGNRGRGGPRCPCMPPHADQRSVAASGPAAWGDRSEVQWGKTMLLPPPSSHAMPPLLPPAPSPFMSTLSSSLLLVPSGEMTGLLSMWTERALLPTQEGPWGPSPQNLRAKRASLH